MVFRQIALSLVTLILAVAAYAASPEVERLELSPTFTLTWPKKWNLQFVPIPSTNGFWLEGKKGPQTLSLWTSRSWPNTVANQFSVNRLWKQSLADAQALGEISTDLGCHRTDRRAYRCERTARSPAGQGLAEVLIWNSNSDLTVVRISGQPTEKDAATLLSQMQTLFKSNTQRSRK